jgi:hypothetical protein
MVQNYRINLTYPLICPTKSLLRTDSVSAVSVFSNWFITDNVRFYDTFFFRPFSRAYPLLSKHNYHWCQELTNFRESICRGIHSIQKVLSTTRASNGTFAVKNTIRKQNRECTYKHICSLRYQHAMPLRRIVTCSLPGSISFFHIYHKRHDFRKTRLLNVKYI